MRARSKAWVALSLLTAACSGTGQRSLDGRAAVANVTESRADPTVRPAQLVPEYVDERTAFGSEPGGGLRILVAGLRAVTWPNGAIVASSDRLPSPPTVTLALPERLGHGFLFVIGATVWRADGWLTPAKPIFTFRQTVQAVLPGLDRIYVRGPSMMVALDARSGHVLDLGAWPSSPNVTSYAAVDGWRAAAIADLRGILATFDAGASWTKLEVPMEAKRVVASGENLAIGGIDAKRNERWLTLHPDGSLTELEAPPREFKGKLVSTPPTRGSSPPTREPAAADDRRERTFKPFGKRPLAVAIEDGWPLGDGTAIVAREGALGRVRLSDGALVDFVGDAFPLKTATCHPLMLAIARQPGAFGFVCGEARGTTAIYAYERTHGRLTELRHFDSPRSVTAGGNGTLAVRGACAAVDEPRRPGADMHAYCIYNAGRTWREVRVPGDGESERVVALADGRIAVLMPPKGADGSAQLTLLDAQTSSAGERATRSVPVSFAPVSNEVARVLRLGLWLNGFEERRPGVLSGWIEAQGVMLGVELELDGKAKAGEFLRDAGLPFVSGRYGLGSTASRRGYETTDGGMSWKSIDLPDPLLSASRMDRRACGPVGCLAYGWLRVGWGEQSRAAAPAAPPPYRSSQASTAARLELTCERMAPPPPEPVASSSSGRTSRTNANGLAPGLLTGELPPFHQLAGPKLAESDYGVSLDVRELVDRSSLGGLVGRVYAWGPNNVDWTTLGRWQLRWLSPFDGWQALRSTVPSAPPAQLLDVVRTANTSPTGMLGLSGVNYTYTIGEDPAHALLVGRRLVRAEVSVFELEENRVPVEVRRTDGEPFGELDSAVRAQGSWFVATSAATTEAPTTTVWRIEGGSARELARVFRARSDGTNLPRPRLARSSDGRAVALIVDGQLSPDRALSLRWALPIHLETGALGDLEPLGLSDLSDRTLEVCSSDFLGWELDTSLGASSLRLRVAEARGSFSPSIARLRVSGSRACIEGLAATYDGSSVSPSSELALPAGSSVHPRERRPGEVSVGVSSQRLRFGLRCVDASKGAAPSR